MPSPSGASAPPAQPGDSTPGTATLYPVFLDLAGAPVLVVGGGPVAARKVAGLVAAGAVVSVVALAVAPELVSAGPAVVHRRAFQPDDVAGFRLVFTATGRPEVDAAVFAAATASGIWANSADDPPSCSFQLPAVLRRGPVTVAVSSAGRSPALASWLRDRIGQAYGEELAELAAAIATQRDAIRAAGESTEGIDWAARIDAAWLALRASSTTAT